MVVARVREEDRGGHLHRHVEADDVAVERAGRLDVADVQVQMAGPQALRHVAAALAGLGVEVAHVQRLRPGAVALEVRPRVARAVGGELEAVAVRVGQVDRLVRAVIGHALHGRLRDHDPLQRPRELLARGVQQRHVVEAGVAPGGPGARLLVQHEHVVRAGAQGRRPVPVAVDPEPDRVLVERDRAVEVRDREMGGAQPHGYADLMALTSSASLTLSATSMLPEPSAWLNFMSQSLRLSWPVISRPTRSLPHGSMSVPWASACSTISLVTPCIVRLPVIRNSSSSSASIAVDSNVICGRFSASKKSGERRCASRWSSPVSIDATSTAPRAVAPDSEISSFPSMGPNLPRTVAMPIRLTCNSTPGGAARGRSAALGPRAPTRPAAVSAGACARSPMTVAGEPELAKRITTADLARLAALVGVGEAWQGEAAIAGVPRPVLATAAASAGAGSLLVLILRDGERAGDDVVALVTRMWALVAGRMGQHIEEAEPTALAASRQAASERARVADELTEAHAATLSALLGTLRAGDLDDRAARRAATDLAASALVELRSAARREREMPEEPVAQAFALLRDELRPLVRYSSAELEFAAPQAEGSVPGPVAQAARAIVRGAVVTMLEQQEGVRRIRVGWALDGDLRVSVRDDGPGLLAGEGLALRALVDRARAVDGEIEVEGVPGWGSHLQARLPLGMVRETVAPAGPLAALNPRELEVLAQLARGRRNRQIAELLSISENTVKFHVANVLAKLGVGSRGEAAAIARDAGIEVPLQAVA